MHDRHPNLDRLVPAPTRLRRADGPRVSAAVRAPSERVAASVRWRVWVSIALRAVALGIALVGLAGIGLVVSREAAPLAAPSVSHAGFEPDALSHRALAALGGPDHVPDAAASASAAPPAPPAPVPCPRLPNAGDSDENGPLPSAGRAAASGRPAAASEPRAEGSERPVVLNRADAAELRRLPGVGAKRAEAILLLRQRLGRFRRPADLLRVKGIGPRTLERLLPHVVVD
jgi:competence protein ComEA